MGMYKDGQATYYNSPRGVVVSHPKELWYVSATSYGNSQRRLMVTRLPSGTKTLNRQGLASMP